MPTPASRRRGVVRVDDADGALIGAGGTRHRLLSIPGYALDADTLPDQERHAALFGQLAASLPHKAALSIYVENRPADAAAIVAGLRAQLAPTPHTPQLAEVGARLLSRWQRRLTDPGARHVARIDYWLLVSPYPARDGYPDQSAPARLAQAVAALTSQLVAMGVPPVVADAATTRAFVARHLLPRRDANGETADYSAPTIDEAEEAFHTYKVVDPASDRARWTRTLFIVAPPDETQPAWTRPLVLPECPATLVFHLRGLRRSWERRRQEWRLKLMEGTAGRKNIGTKLAAEDAEAQATALHGAGYSVVKVGCYLRLEGDTRAQLDGRVSHALQAMGDTMVAGAGYGHAHQRPLYRSTLPGYGDVARSTYRWDTPTWGNAWPFLAGNPGTRTLGVPLGTTDAAGDLVTLALGDPDLYNRIGVILGRVGTGKTSLLQKVALWFLLTGNYATVVSSVDSFAALCAIAGGPDWREARATLGGARSACINVFDGPRADADDRRERVRFVTAAVDLLLGGLAGLEPAFLDEAVRDVYAAHPDDTPIMADLHATLDAKGKATTDTEDRKVYRGLAWRLSPYVGDGQHARLVDGQTNVRLDAPLLAFNTEPLEGDATLRNFAYFSVFAVVDRRRALARARSRAANRGTADHLTGLDEAWGLLTSPQAREYINRDARKARHGGNCVLFASQQVKDLVGNSDAETFFTQASFKALYSIEDTGQQTEGNPKLWLQRMLSLTEEEVEAAQRMSGAKGVYMPMFMTRRDRKSARDLHGVVRVELTPEEALLYASDPDDVALRTWWADEHGDGDTWEGIKAAIDSTEQEERLTA